MIVSEEGYVPRCHPCKLFVVSMLEICFSSGQCSRFTEQQCRDKEAEENHCSCLDLIFRVGSKLIEFFCWFKYLGRILMDEDDDTAMVLK